MSTLHPLEKIENHYSSNQSWKHIQHVILGSSQHTSHWDILEWHWKLFNKQMDSTCQIIQSLSQWLSAPTQQLSSLQAELTNIHDIYTSYKPIIIPAINLLDTDPSFDGNSNYNEHVRSLLPFLGDALSWLMGTATTKDVNSVKSRVNQLIEAQSTQKDAIVHIVSILNVTRYTAQVNRQHTNILMDRVDEMVKDVDNLYNITTSLPTSLSYHQLVLHLRFVLANLWDSLSYIKGVSIHIMDYINAATTGTLLPHIYPLQILCRCCHILRRPYLLQCIYQYHLRTPYTFIDTFVPMS